MCQREDGGCSDDGRSFAWQQSKESQQEITLQKELLHQGPHDVAPSVQEDRRGTVQTMQRMSSPSDEDRNRRKHKSDSNDPERLKESFAAEAQHGPAIAARPGGRDDPRKGKPVENSLGGIGRPNGCQDEEVAHCKFKEIPLGRPGLIPAGERRRCWFRRH